LVGSGAGAGGGVTGAGVTAGGFLPHAATVNAEHSTATVAHHRKVRIINISFSNWTGRGRASVSPIMHHRNRRHA
jgi:hypothetical protein